MQRLQGNVQYKDRKDIVCSYGVMDDGTNYFFIGEPLSNGNIIVSTDLKEAIDPMEPASHIGVIDPDGNVVIPLENRKIKTLSDDVTDILVVERAVPVTENVIDANNKKNDPSEATTIVSTQSVIKDKINTLIGPEGRFASNNPFGEASIYDLNGNNLANGAYYSYIAYGNGKVYMATNVENAEINEYSVLPPEVQANVTPEANTEGAIDVAAVADNSEAIAEAINTEMDKAAEEVVAPEDNAIVTDGVAGETAPEVSTEEVVAENTPSVDVTSAVPPVVGEDQVVETEGIAPAVEETAVAEEVSAPVETEVPNVEIPAIEGETTEEVVADAPAEVAPENVSEEAAVADVPNVEVPAVEEAAVESVAAEETVVTDVPNVEVPNVGAANPEEGFEAPSVEEVQATEIVANEPTQEVVAEAPAEVADASAEVASENVVAEEAEVADLPAVDGMSLDEIVANAQAKDAEENAQEEVVEETAPQEEIVSENSETSVDNVEETAEAVENTEAVEETVDTPTEEVAEEAPVVEIAPEEVANVTDDIPEENELSEGEKAANELGDIFNQETTEEAALEKVEEPPVEETEAVEEQEEVPTEEEVTDNQIDDTEDEIEVEKPVSLVDLVDEDYYEPKEFKADTISIDDSLNDYDGMIGGYDEGSSVIESIKAGVEKTYADNARLQTAVQTVKKKLEDTQDENLHLKEVIEKKNGLINQLKDNQDILVSKCKELQAELRNTKNQLNGLAELSQLIESRSDSYVRTGRRSSGYDIDDIISSGRGRRAA